MADDPHIAASESLADAVQAHIGRASRFADGKTRTWSFFFFFRILTQAEVRQDIRRLKQIKPGDLDANAAVVEEIALSLADPALMNAGVVEQELIDWDKRGNVPRDEEECEGAQAALAPDMPAQLFLDWLHLIAEADTTRLVRTFELLLGCAGISVADPLPAGDKQDTLIEQILDNAVGGNPSELAETLGVLADRPGGLQQLAAALLPALSDNPAAVRALLQAVAGAIVGQPVKSRLLPELLRTMVAAFMSILQDREAFESGFLAFGHNAASAGANALAGGLPSVCLYEMLRQLAPAHLTVDGRKLVGITRSERAEDDVPKPGMFDRRWDPAPINIAFTHSGLAALKLDQATLASFPDAFREGMAARAERLGDTGQSAPEFWEGPLGLKRLHGYVTGGYLVGEESNPADPALWQALRDDAHAFNARSGDWGWFLRLILNLFFRLIGMELLHIEIGEDPYDAHGCHGTSGPTYRREHFGFRDGISQPFVDMRLGDTARGGGTPGRNRTWIPVAPGEIFLDEPDEDGNLHQQPAHPLLRRGSTYLVFRKLEQDVAGLRIFLARQRPKDKEAQEKLVSQFMGRWRNGTPLVLSPDAPLELGRDPDGQMNDFLYAADDPDGRKCPLAAHVRRTNPRDIGGSNNVRRHRILRRSISYGGPFLKEGALGDGNKRGLLFVAANARIDLQFEVVQAVWINKGEFLGQAGLARCPIAGSNHGRPGDMFLEADAVAPITGLPRFVTTRGGDYFFAPGLPGIKAIANGNKFPIDPCDLPFKGYSMGDTRTPDLFDRDRLASYGRAILSGQKTAVRVEPPGPPSPGDPASSPVVFVARHADVKTVLKMRLKGKKKKKEKIIHSVAHYRDAGRRISRYGDILIGTEPGSETAETRCRMMRILDTCWKDLDDAVGARRRLARIADRQILSTLRRTGPSRRIDLVHDLATETAYGVIDDLFGVPGPDWLTELAVALPFSKRHFGEISPEWLSALGAQRPDNPGLKTMQVWAVAVLLDLVANHRLQEEVKGISLKAGTEFLAHIDLILEKARSSPPPRPQNLVHAFVHKADYFVEEYDYTKKDYYSDVRMLLLELTGTTIAVVPMAFGAIMGALFDFGIDLADLLALLRRKSADSADEAVHRIIYETTRLRPIFEILMRRCVQDDALPSGAVVQPNEWVASLIGAANLDPRKHEQPLLFSLHPYLPGPPRPLEDFLLFGAVGDDEKVHRTCWGRDRLALYLLQRCLLAAGRLDNLQRVAGPAGEPKTMLNVIVGLTARFDKVRPEP
ncbi:Dyp-type peroxidase domain-containing protein [Mesorhizobium sp. L-8-3]|uniref:Dyp-type peroxidase domain-containing protein n=1 Tax=Mesorhizobium sp. L-8-3 TaxID=2744522 RepID=UPI001925333D|nr:Dyp-type peroxidase domain-containing protein [Mesorhizobium sp. L-8-3]BCH22661.1 hypothetical protein MesoLjLb_24460 [Mesorhizobium sp. L-8-3]